VQVIVNFDDWRQRRLTRQRSAREAASRRSRREHFDSGLVDSATTMPAVIHVLPNVDPAESRYRGPHSLVNQEPMPSKPPPWDPKRHCSPPATGIGKSSHALWLRVSLLLTTHHYGLELWCRIPRHCPAGTSSIILPPPGSAVSFRDIETMSL
jgi:hypothetical protein